MQPGVDLLYFKLRLFVWYNSEIIVWNIKGLWHWIAEIWGLKYRSMFIAKTVKFVLKVWYIVIGLYKGMILTNLNVGYKINPPSPHPKIKTFTILLPEMFIK